MRLLFMLFLGYVVFILDAWLCDNLDLMIHVGF